MKQTFIEWSPKKIASIKLLQDSIEVVEDYGRQGYALTLRQLYYQLVSRDLLPNQVREYKRLGELISNARLGGHIDWNAIVDRGRAPVMASAWDSPASILDSAAWSYRSHRWEDQEYYVEVWCEKDALSSVIEPVCNEHHVRFMANKGYSSSTAMYDAARRFDGASHDGQKPVVIYLGDHDPSGIDMSRDIRDRLMTMAPRTYIENQRLALNMDQVEEYQPPPNPAKTTDSRFLTYVVEYGDDSWELDALEPQVLNQLVTDAILNFMDEDLYQEKIEQEDKDKAAIRKLAETFRAGQDQEDDEDE